MKTVEFIADKQLKRKIASDILNALPDWFGIPESTAEYIEKSADMPFWAYRYGKDYVGFTVLKKTSEYAAEIYVTGVLPAFHRKGIGRDLFSEFYGYAKSQGYEYIQVKTVAEGRYEQYDRTIKFYEKMGLRKLEVLFELWDKNNPCLVMVMKIE